MEKYCHFIAIYTLLSASIFFHVGNPLFFHFQNVCFASPFSRSPLDLWPPHLGVGVGPKEGGGGERMSCLCVRVCSAGIGGRGGGALLPSFSLYVKNLEFVVTVHRQRPLEFVSGGVGSRTFYHRGPATLCFIFLCFDHFFF